MMCGYKNKCPADDDIKKYKSRTLLKFNIIVY